MVLAYNIQREDILPSEKAKAYRMKYDAMKHQGSRTGGLTLEELSHCLLLDDVWIENNLIGAKMYTIFKLGIS